MSHLKRQEVPKNWPVPRKGTTFVVKPVSDMENTLPVLIVLRDVLKVAKTRKEVKKALSSKNILVNGKVANDERLPLGLFDVVSLVPSKKNYKMTLKNNGKFDVEEISDKETGQKVSKIIDKKVLKGKKTQLNLYDGRNFIYDKDCKVNDSVLVDLREKKILKCLPLKEGSSAIVFAGKHAGKSGKIELIDREKKIASIKTEDSQINVLIKQFMVTE